MEKKGYQYGIEMMLKSCKDEHFQMIRLSEGCPHKCPWCYEWKVIGDDWKVFPIPEIVRNYVRIADMNLLARKRA